MQKSLMDMVFWNYNINFGLWNFQKICCIKLDNLPIGYVLEEATYWIEQQAESKDANIEEGELIVVSDSVCDGYYKQPTLTEACFFKFDGKRGYRTRDLVYKKDNLLYFKGRTDFQIKLNGYRIE